MTDFDAIPLFYLALPVVAFLYASVGHGGASGYLALMILFSFPPPELKSTALILNCFVSGISFIQFYRRGHFNFRLFLMIALASVPFAFIGGRMNVDDPLFRKLLGLFLVFAVLRLLGLFKSAKKETDTIKPVNKFAAIGIGSGIGFISGLLGIGGGIILTPLLLLLRWTTLQIAAGISALFILVNSFAGILGLYTTQNLIVHPNLTLMIILTVAGGFLGGFLGSSALKNNLLRYILAIVLSIATIKLLLS